MLHFKIETALFSHKHIFRKMFAIPFTIFGFILYVATGNIAGLVILLNDITDSSISDVKVGVFSLLFVLGIPFLLTMSGIIYASNENKKQPLLISIIVSLSFFLILFNVPQNAIIRFNHGIVKTPKNIEAAIKSASNTSCKTMYTITHGEYTLFSCGDKKSAFKGKIFYERMSDKYINMVSNNKKFIVKAYCFTSGRKQRLNCVYRYDIVPQ